MNREVESLLRSEGLVGLVVGIVLYTRLEGSWLLFALLFLVPDISMIGYLRDQKIGAAAYNAIHTYLGPALLGAVAWWLGSVLIGQLAVIWMSHIGFDRMLGFGLKYPSGFGDTHLGMLKGSSSGTGLRPGQG